MHKLPLLCGGTSGGTVAKLTLRQLSKLDPGMHADGHGLYLNVKPSGARSWIFRATINGRRKEIGLGGYPVVSLQEARDAAVDMQRQVRAGIDPVAERVHKQRTVTTFEDIDTWTVTIDNREVYKVPLAAIEGG